MPLAVTVPAPGRAHGHLPGRGALQGTSPTLQTGRRRPPPALPRVKASTCGTVLPVRRPGVRAVDLQGRRPARRAGRPALYKTAAKAPLGPVPGWPGGDIGAGAVWVPAMPLISRVCDTVYCDNAVPRRGRPEVESPALRSATRPSLGRPTSSHLPGPARARQARRRGRRGPVSPTYMGLIKTSPSLFQF